MKGGAQLIVTPRAERDRQKAYAQKSGVICPEVRLKTFHITYHHTTVSSVTNLTISIKKPNRGKRAIQKGRTY